MKDTRALKRELDQQVDQLSEARLQEVLDFVGYLLHKKNRPAPPPGQPQNPERDPILELIGSVDVEPFADDVDEELYGV